MSQHYDAVVIGGGPGGSTVATFLARAGRKVLLLEREKFPRFHVGESLLPFNLAGGALAFHPAPGPDPVRYIPRVVPPAWYLTNASQP